MYIYKKRERKRKEKHIEQNVQIFSLTIFQNKRVSKFIRAQKEMGGRMLSTVTLLRILDRSYSKDLTSLV